MNSKNNNHINKDRNDTSVPNSINAETEGTSNETGAPLTRGTDSAIVWFRQFSSVVSILCGNGVSGVF